MPGVLIVFIHCFSAFRAAIVTVDVQGFIAIPAMRFHNALLQFSAAFAGNQVPIRIVAGM
ncbi:hypothetical protein D3878_08185 [Noviherbaspirillum sedimenti]|uniref:Uncharacterized protein n=1 Tax=Noviherbaspirillum sedimenti TaxID=2320865 RepID=A0A3A3GH24_9BURK|nr:hypothetical protein D3878_08185 [Noviherbaspirillum sedimenti]